MKQPLICLYVDSEESRMREIESILASENSRLRAELERLRQQPQPIIIQPPAQVQLTTHTQFSLSDTLTQFSCNKTS